MQITDYTVVTANEYKIKEIQKILINSGKFNGKMVFEKINLREIQGTCEEIAIDKCRIASNFLKKPVIVDDVSLEIKKLNGFPGPYIKWMNNSMTCKEIYELVGDCEATAICTIAICDGFNKEIKTFQGKLDGFIEKPDGPEVNGFDCIFRPKYNMFTLARISEFTHRTLAFKKLFDYLEKN